MKKSKVVNVPVTLPKLKLEIQERPLGWFIPYEKNPRKNDAVVDKMADLILAYGFRVPILSKSTGHVIDGHLRLKAAFRLVERGQTIETLPTIFCDDWSEDMIKAFRYAVNKSAAWADWDEAQARIDFGELQTFDFDLALTGFDPHEIGAFLGSGSTDASGEDPPTPAPREKPVTKWGDVWTLGQHRIMCGDSTIVDNLEKLLQGELLDLMLTDPPYCSGGFQESDRHSGSVGTDAVHELVANDTLSTRGYIALMKTVLVAVGAPSIYMFTDWRMWVNLFDVCESSGFGVRNMIVWNKGTPGMGRGWRAQHEIILFGTKARIKFDAHKAQGNVISCERTGNTHHTTEKPVKLLNTILHVSEFAKSICDPFLGSGSTLIACEQTNRRCFGMELKPAYVDVTIERWQAFTNQKAVHFETGKTWEEMRSERLI